ncbi:MAG: chain length determinant protein EpsF, partial [Bacillota bacterium]
FQQFLLALRGRLKIFFALLGATVVTVAIVTFFMPRTYDAYVSVLADVKDEQMLNAPAGSPRLQQGYMQTQIDILQSQRVAREVVEKLKLADNPRVRAEFQRRGGRGAIEDWIASGLLADLKVDSSQSSVIQLKYSSSDPKFAANVANAFANAYVDTSLKLRTEPTKEAAAWFDDQLKDLRKQLETAQAKLAAFQREKGILVNDERLDVETTRLTELSNESLKAAEANYDASARVGQARGRRGIDSAPDVIANPLVQTLKAELLKDETKLHELSTRIGPNHPEYRQVQAEVQALRERIATESNKVVGSVESVAGQNSARLAALQRDLDAQRKKVAELRDARSESQVLLRDVDTAQKAYEAALSRYLVNKVESGARQTNVAVLSPATEPLMPAKPKVPLNIALGIFVGMLLGFTAVFFLELLDRRVRSNADLEIAMDAPLIGSLSAWQPSRLLGGGDSPKALPSPV